MTAASSSAHAGSGRGSGPALAALGYAAVWANDNVRRSGLATLAAICEHAPSLEMGLGVAPLSDRSPATIAAEVRAWACRSIG